MVASGFQNAGLHKRRLPARLQKPEKAIAFSGTVIIQKKSGPVKRPPA
jgi:hypothetical protein